VQSASATGAAPAASTAQFDTIAMPPVPSPTQPDVWAVAPPAITATQTSAATIAPQRSGAQNQLGSLLCSIGGFRNTLGGSAQLAQRLNEVLAVLGS
jgi:hypothetical protein